MKGRIDKGTGYEVIYCFKKFSNMEGVIFSFITTIMGYIKDRPWVKMKITIQYLMNKLDIMMAGSQAEILRFKFT